MEPAESSSDSRRVFTRKKGFVQLGMAGPGIACCSKSGTLARIVMQAPAFKFRIQARQDFRVNIQDGVHARACVGGSIALIQSDQHTIVELSTLTSPLLSCNLFWNGSPQQCSRVDPMSHVRIEGAK